MNNLNKLNDITNSEEKYTKEIDEIEIEHITHPCLAVFLFIICMIFIPFNIVLIVTGCDMYYKKIIFYDEVEKELIKTFVGIWKSCKCCECLQPNKRIYDLTQIQKVKIYRTSIPDPVVAFKKIYFIKCDIYSLDNQTETVFDRIPYSKEKFDEFVTFFQKHLNTEIIPLEVDINNYNVNNNDNGDFPLLNEQNQTPV